MKRTLAAFILTTALSVLANREAVAQAWQTVDQFQLDPSFSAAANDIGTGGDGATLFSVGWVIYNSSGNNAGIIRRSTDSGATWSTVDTYLEENWTSAYYRAIGSGADGAIYAGGEIWAGAPNTGTKTWIVRESVDNGTTWAPADAFYEGVGAKPSCGDVKVNPYTGDVFAVGRGNTGSDQGFYWLARKRAANAQDFATVDLVGAPPINEARAVGFHPTAGVFVVGRIGDSHGNSLWSVRRSRDGGATWATVDTFSDAGNTSSEARAIAVNPLSGAIYVCGQAIQAVADLHDGGGVGCRKRKARLEGRCALHEGLRGAPPDGALDRQAGVPPVVAAARRART